MLTKDDYVQIKNISFKEVLDWMSVLYDTTDYSLYWDNFSVDLDSNIFYMDGKFFGNVVDFVALKKRMEKAHAAKLLYDTFIAKQDNNSSSSDSSPQSNNVELNNLVTDKTLTQTKTISFNPESDNVFSVFNNNKQFVGYLVIAKQRLASSGF